MRPTRWLLIGSIGALLAGCSSGASNSVTGPQNNGNGNNGQNSGTNASAAMSATVNGVAWASVGPVQASYIASNHQLTFTGVNGQTIVTVSVAHVTATGTFSLAYLNVDGSSAIVATGTSGWDTFLPGGTGSATFTTFTTHHAVGTFAFVGVPGTTGTTGTMPVTNGKFDVTF